MDGHVGAHVPRAVAGAQVLDRHDPAGHEAAQRDDRHRHVHVEDLLHEALVGVQRRVEEHERQRRGQRDDGRDRERLESLRIHQSSSR